MTTDVGNKFVLLMTGRSGSAWVMSTLSRLQHVTTHEALFLRRARTSERTWDSDFAHPRFVETKSDGLNFRPFSVFLYLNALYETPGAVGFKLNYVHLAQYPEILAYLIRHRIRIVHLVRRNHLDVIISWAVKTKIGQAHLLADHSTPDDLRVELDTKDLIKQLEWMQKRLSIVRKLLSWCRLPHLEIAYEDLLRDRAHFRFIFNFLSIKPEGDVPESIIVKTRRGGHCDVISNYNQVKEVLANSKFTGLLE